MPLYGQIAAGRYVARGSRSVTVLVTGGAGFIGSHVVDLLVGSGHRVRVLDVVAGPDVGSSGAQGNEGAEYVCVDLRDADVVERAVTGVEAVVHHAGMVGLGRHFGDVTDYVSHNDTGTAVLLSALYGCGFSGRLVLASSMVVYGEGCYECPRHGTLRPGPRARGELQGGRFDPTCSRCGLALVPRPVTEDTPGDPRNVYAATKLHQEHLCAAFGRETGASVVALRYHNVYGPRMPRATPYAGVASIFRSALERGDPPRVTEDGRQLRDFVHVLDVARANAAALAAADEAAGAYNISSGEPRSVGELAAALARSVGANSPAPVITGHYRLGDVRHIFASPAKARTRLGWTAEIAFEAGMEELALAP
jgi:dTDP-L-rhamnose 4-epimerase